MLSRSRKAFTLLELIVVIVILGILAALAIPTFARVIEKSRKQSAETTAAALGRDAVALGAFDELKGSDETKDTSDAAGTTYLNVVSDEVSGASVAGSVVTVKGYAVTLAFTDRGVTVASSAKL